MSRHARVEQSLPGETPEWERRMNPEQLEAVRHEGGPLLVLAVAGAGKTSCLVNRIVRLVRHVGVSAERICAVTFSRKAAEEMDARCRMLGVPAQCKTWHSLCGRIIHEDETPWRTWDSGDKVEGRAKALVKAAIGYKHENWKGGDATKVRRYIAVCKANLFAPGSPEALKLASTPKWFAFNGRRAANVYVISQQLIEAEGLLTFDDMLVFAHRWLSDEDNRGSWAGKFDYLLVDEGQDDAPVQKELRQMLARDHRNIMAVGDLCQSLYSFRGAVPEILADFEQEWPGAKRVEMFRNYRCGSRIIDAANAVVSKATLRMRADMSAERGTEGTVRVVECDTLEDEAAELASYVRSYMADGGKASDFYVLFRLNAQSRAIEEAFIKEKLPYRLIGGVSFYERKEVKDLLAYLRVVADRDPRSDALKRCINAPFRYLGARFVERMMAEHKPGADPVESAWSAARQDGIQGRQRASVQEWADIIRYAQGALFPTEGEPEKPGEVLAEIVRRTNYIERVETEEGAESIESSHGANVREMVRVALSFETVGEMLDYVELQIAESGKNARRADSDAVTMMSVHRSKGLESKVVWLIGCNDGILPHAKGDPEEERRIMYVAVTRARDELVVSHVREMATRTGLRTVMPSGFVDEILLAPVGEMPIEEVIEAATGDVLARDPEGAIDEAVLRSGEDEGEVRVTSDLIPAGRSWLGDGNCHDCGAPLATHGDAC